MGSLKVFATIPATSCYHHAHICDNRYALLECSDITKRWRLHYTESVGGIQASAVL
ncbi:hypothetical protein AVDCRST_MAG92-615 [uncultured Coleofasciculus sp.]|uniref:Uncharacterized protein n=1 Tax=uncultured Coleofasciculus sp. TaxID=1267456 RepID=A0A6J4HF50_9CYAN|nr:hypothetical protein AVDCRST_MAG92-615 [uncultured Coleofasciculus sp.]